MNCFLRPSVWIYSLIVCLIGLLGPSSARAGWSFPPIDIVLAPGNFNDPDIAVDGAGNAIAIWVQVDGLNQDVRTSILPRGGTWSTPVVITTCPILFHETIAVTPSGNAIALWVCQSGGGTINNVQAATLTIGGTWSAPVNISATSTNAFFPRLAINDQGDAVAAWDIFDGSNTVVQAATFHATSTSPFTGTWTPPTTLSPPGFNTGNLNVAINNSGKAVAVWSVVFGPTEIIQASIFNGSSWFPAQTISNTLFNSRDPSVALDSKGNAVAVWVGSNGTFNLIQASKLSAKEGTWSNPVLLSPNGFNSDTPVVRVDGFGNFIAVWVKTSVANNSVQWATLLSGKKKWTAARDIAVVGLNGGFQPDLAVNTFGNTVATWRRFNGFFDQVAQAATLQSPTSSSWSPPTDISNGGSTLSPIAAAINASGYAVTDWRQDSTTNIQSSVGTDLFPPTPASNLKGKVLKNQFLTQTDRIHQLTWTPSTDPAVVGYKIFGNSVLLATVSQLGPFKISFHDQSSKVPVTYTIVSFKADGEISTSVSVTLQ